MACATFGWPFAIGLNKYIRKFPYRVVALATFSPSFELDVCTAFVVCVIHTHTHALASICMYVWNAPKNERQRVGGRMYVSEYVLCMWYAIVCSWRVCYIDHWVRQTETSQCSKHEQNSKTYTKCERGIFDANRSFSSFYLSFCLVLFGSLPRLAAIHWSYITILRYSLCFREHKMR